jgi:hypothetical protein
MLSDSTFLRKRGHGSNLTGVNHQLQKRNKAKKLAIPNGIPREGIQKKIILSHFLTRMMIK